MKSSKDALGGLSRRERQIMEIVYAQGRVDAQTVQDLLPDRPSYSAVRAALSSLTKKDKLRHTREGLRYYFEPTVPQDRARASMLSRMLKTFFNNSAESVMATLLDSEELKIGPEELDRLEKMIRERKKKTRH